ncbi:MAG: bifunctional (p)ppGpp synthetase/guanosine-3',5'-bis(diphosphate) 3'-pyrophosphohydrolase [Candidatus Doudnabacteria bacterium]|nr:bifunctional (p)ppGpp synthetase/guanosine-3',5'-bis(diphosphate) 3'-pyrophosphohydrolase [Candidatus Doudnabacteria bacterium]
MTYEEVYENLKKHYREADLKLFERAYRFAATAHAGQKRKSGDSYVSHSLAVANYLGEGLQMDMETLVAALLHDVPEETKATLHDIKKQFGEQVAFLVSGVTKLGKIKLRDQTEETYIETLRNMFLAMAADIRVVLIKLADRLNNMRSLRFLPVEKQQRIARETLEVYAPIANRLGMGQLKGELEDLAFPYVLPGEYEWLTRDVAMRYEEMQAYVDRVRKIIARDLHEAKIKIEDINGRAKHLYSLFEKVISPKYERDLSKIYDLVALRIITHNLEDCYAVLGVLHSKYRPLPGRIKDYIAFPKPNGYRSIHTTVFGPEKRILEVQIRTMAMHREAEYGIAAHWAYEEKGKPEKGVKVPLHQLDWIRQLRDWQKEHGGSGEEFIESLKIDFFKNRIFVLTPKGEVKDLPEGATSLDFAFAVHTDLGLVATGAKINHKMARLGDELENGDVVEILKSKEPRVSRDWLRIVRTSNARSKIKSYLNKNQQGWLTDLIPGFIKRK